MRYGHPLTEEPRELLEHTMKDDASFRARPRAHSLLLSAQGMTIKDIAKTSQVHRVTVSAWLTQWERQGVQSWHDHPRSGRPSPLTPDAQELAKPYLKDDPRSLNGVVARLATSTGTRCSMSARKRLAKKAVFDGNGSESR